MPATDTPAAGTDAATDPRVARSKAAVLDAAVELLAESGYAGATIEGIAARSGVAKTTIYRHWPSRATLLLDAFDAVIHQPDPVDTGSVGTDLAGQLTRAAAAIEESDWARILPSLVEAAERDPELAELAHEFSQRRRAPLRAILERGIERGEVRADLDLDTTTEMIAGPLFYRRFISRAPVTREFVDTLVETIVRVVSP